MIQYSCKIKDLDFCLLNLEDSYFCKIYDQRLLLKVLDDCCYCSLSPKRGSRSPAKNNRRKPITGARSDSPALSSSPPHKTAREINSLSPRGDGRSRSPTPPRRRNARVSRSLSPRKRSLSPGRQAGNGKSGANVRSPGVDAGPDSPRVEHEVSHLHDNDRSHSPSAERDISD